MGFGPIPKEALETPEEPTAQSTSTDPDSGIGTVRYFGDYELLEQIGRGGMGVVFKARQISLRRLVALKMISAGKLASPTAVQRFHIEAEAVAKLDHPNIVPIYEIGVHKGQHYFSMKVVEGESLEEKLRKPNTDSPTTDHSRAATVFGRSVNQYSVKDTARLVATIARAVHYAHQRGVIHRDLKPGNILLDAEGQPHITDFGLAKILEHEIGVTRTAELMGTPSYMSPEQAAGRQLSISTDLWSLGAILYEMLAGRPPFGAENTPALLRKIAEEDPVPPSKCGARSARNQRGALRSRRPARHSLDLETICLKCLEKDPARRYASAAALADDLDHWLRDEPIQARRATLFERVTKWTRRQPVLAAAVVLLHIVLIAGLAGILWQWSRAEKQLTRAELAETDALARLHEAKLNYVRANRVTGRPGQRFDSLAEIAQAARRTNSLDLRNEAIACLVLPDLRPVKQWVKTPRWYSFRFDPSHGRYATNDASGQVTIRDAETDAVMQEIPARGAKDIFSFVAFSPDERFVATIDQAGQGRLWDELAQAQRPLDLPEGSIVLAFTPDSRALTVKHADASVHFHDTLTGTEEKSFSGPPNLIWNRFQFNPTGEKFFTLINGQIVIRRSLDAGLIRVLALPDSPTNGLSWTAWHPDGRRIASAWLNHIGLWDAETGQRLGVFEGHEGPVVGLAFTRTGQYLASASWDNTTRIWDTDTQREILIFPEGGNNLSISADDRRFSFSTWDHEKVVLFELADLSIGQRLTLPPQARGPDHHSSHTAFSPDGELILIHDCDGVFVFHPPHPRPVALVPVGEKHSVCLTPSGTSLYTGGSSGASRWPIVWSADHSELHVGPPAALEPTRGLPEVGVFPSRDGRWLIARTRTNVLAFAADSPSEAVYYNKILGADPSVSPDGRWVTHVTSSRAQVEVWNGRTGALVTNLPTLGAWEPKFSPDGRWLACAQGDSTLVWDASDWSVHRRFAHPSEIGHQPVAFSPDGRILAISVSNREVRLIKFETGEELARLPARRLMTSLCFSPEGDRLVVTHEPGYFQLWDLRRVREQLAALHLDWNMPPYPPAEPAQATRPFRVIVHTNASANAVPAGN